MEVKAHDAKKRGPHSRRWSNSEEEGKPPKTAMMYLFLYNTLVGLSVYKQRFSCKCRFWQLCFQKQNSFSKFMTKVGNSILRLIYSQGVGVSPKSVLNMGSPKLHEFPPQKRKGCHHKDQASTSTSQRCMQFYLHQGASNREHGFFINEELKTPSVRHQI